MSFFERKKKVWQESCWKLGFCSRGLEALGKCQIHWVSNGRYEGEKWFADPFILDYNDKVVHLLVEEFDYKIHRGRIAKLTIDRDKWVVEDCIIVLDLPTHLSFPMIWREGKDVFVCPENYASGGWNIYRYDLKTDKMVLINQLIDEKLTDAIIYKEGEDYWILSTYVPRPNGRQLTIWHSSTLNEAFVEKQKVNFEENVGRNAGMLFNCNGKLIRPAQESNYSYGHSISFQEVKIEEGHFSFKEIYKFYSPHQEFNEGTHTYNTLGNMAVIDVKGYRYPFLAKSLRMMGNLLVQLHLKKQYRPQ